MTAKEAPSMTTDSSALVRKLWQYCNVLRDDGLSYPDYVEQLTYLLFLKMAEEQDNGPVPAEYSWRSFAGLDAQAMHRHYGRALPALGKGDGMLGLIFRNAKNKIRDPGKLRLLVAELIGQTEWSSLSTDLKGDAYEGLLEKNARDTKSGAGQYFTPRPLIEAIVECVDPRLGEVVCDPACGTGGFLLASHAYLRARNPRMPPAQQRHLATQAIRGVELVEEVARLATMNLLLHGISADGANELPITCADSLQKPPRVQVDVVLTNPPFGVKGSVTYANGRKGKAGDDDLTVQRSDFWAQTANKQLNFLQHVVAMLNPGGRAAVVVPDNVLFEGGAGATVRRKLLEACEVHTLLRLPPGLFYAQGVKANVLFFDKLKSKKRRFRSRLWVYDLRSDNRFSLKTKPLRKEDLAEFVELYQSAKRREQALKGESAVHHRWRAFEIGDILSTVECRLDFEWRTTAAQERTPGLARLDELSRLITDDLQRALALVSKIASRD
jgi:type I restriction enzyme M protein